MFASFLRTILPFCPNPKEPKHDIPTIDVDELNGTPGYQPVPAATWSACSAGGAGHSGSQII